MAEQQTDNGSVGREVHALAVSKGAELLDQHFGSPEWDTRIRFADLHMSNGCDCILGQLFDHTTGENGYESARTALNLWGDENDDPDLLRPTDHGFTLRNPDGIEDPEWGFLEREWIALICRRRADRAR